MSEGLNKVQLIGNLGQDPELKFTQGGQPVLNIRMATTERYIGVAKDDLAEAANFADRRRSKIRVFRGG